MEVGIDRVTQRVVGKRWDEFKLQTLQVKNRAVIVR